MKKLFGSLPEELEPMNDLSLEGARFRLSLETRRFGKAVTVVAVDGWEPENVAQLAHDLKSALGTGGTSKDTVVELQGDHRKRVRAFLGSQGYSVEE